MAAHYASKCNSFQYFSCVGCTKSFLRKALWKILITDTRIRPLNQYIIGILVDNNRFLRFHNPLSGWKSVGDSRRRKESDLYQNERTRSPSATYFQSLRNIRGTSANKREVLPLLHFLSHPMTTSRDLKTGFSISNDANVIVIFPQTLSLQPHGHSTRRTRDDVSFKVDRGIAWTILSLFRYRNKRTDCGISIRIYPGFTMHNDKIAIWLQLLSIRAGKYVYNYALLVCNLNSPEGQRARYTYLDYYTVVKRRSVMSTLTPRVCNYENLPVLVFYRP